MSSLVTSEPKGSFPPPGLQIGCYKAFSWCSYPSCKRAHRSCNALRWPRFHSGGRTIFPEHKLTM